MIAVVSEVGARDDGGDDGTVQAPAFKAEEIGECGDGLGRMGEGELAWNVGDEVWIGDSGASTHMTHSADFIINYRECNLKLRIVDGSTINKSIEGYGKTLSFGPETVSCMPDLRYHLYSPLTLVKNGHTSEGRPTGVVVRRKSEHSIILPLIGTV